jgi:hypothetical protein
MYVYVCMYAVVRYQPCREHSHETTLCILVRKGMHSYDRNEMLCMFGPRVLACMHDLEVCMYSGSA